MSIESYSDSASPSGTPSTTASRQRADGADAHKVAAATRLAHEGTGAAVRRGEGAGGDALMDMTLAPPMRFYSDIPEIATHRPTATSTRRTRRRPPPGSWAKAGVRPWDHRLW
ncbi:hypothetical protein GCM10010390_78700 [Streptomyces mordarskii]|uniref:Uncharacterized protein n=1 Tax=Streptomyces mordarskii TaxID=1226758 RepID=A0ABN1EEK1_9ACTN